ncbi:Nif3-like dinuclear metal center hexameric protein [Rhodococcus antarcticus]|uniref:GTP cyclohydrolase 1 type 2 homolog n=1 Tax=Rhodococcus antarcticus TaxID=2987751 RepID=A0ABY6NW64_9NOCA|nr:Nif3-like dinuclear metal center hexameric protein [Rhodococcus antarcticus]UZJ23622.1 Nif3-like dinuclear metal center hexameric protein [Rhodococcus antarcticus]
MSTLADLVSVLEQAYPPELAEDWDAVGLVCGDPNDYVRQVLVAVDATEAVVEEALSTGAQALVVHHPLLLRGVTGVGADTPKGALVHRLVRGGCALFTAHTNADRAAPGVSDALAEALGLRVLGPLEPELVRWDKVVTTVPSGAAVQRVRAALLAAGAGTLGEYTEAAFTVAGRGQFRPGPGANPAIGTRGALEHVAEEQVQVLAPRGLRRALVSALVAAHPYEEPAYDVLEVAPRPGPRGLGRVGELDVPETLRAFTSRVAAGLPSTAWGVRAAGDPGALVRTVAVCGGSGDSLLGTVARLGVDAFVTADLRHHPADEHLRGGGPALVDVAHWASEQPWCGQAARVVTAALGGTVTARVSTRRTDPWTLGTGHERGTP